MGQAKQLLLEQMAQAVLECVVCGKEAPIGHKCDRCGEEIHVHTECFDDMMSNLCEYCQHMCDKDQ